MALKKSDKIIAIIGVIILIVAAVGIFLYADLEEEETTPGGEREMKIYEIHYDEIMRSAMPDNSDYSIKAKLLGRGSYEGVVDISQQNLKSVEVFVEYHDNKAGLLWRFGRIRAIGADTITITIYDDMENEKGRESIKGDGNVTIPVKSDGDMISLDPIEAEDQMSANDILQQRFIPNHETYTIHISLKTGLWGKIRELLGKDSFILDINYKYYDYYLEEKSDEDFDDGLPPTGDNQGAQTWAPMAYPGKN